MIDANPYPNLKVETNFQKDHDPNYKPEENDKHAMMQSYISSNVEPCTKGYKISGIEDPLAS